MVTLHFQVLTSLPIQECWKYFSDFSNMEDWDPNVKFSKLLKKTKDAQVYRLITVFNDQQSQVDYVVQEKIQNKKIVLVAQNDTITAQDTISFRKAGKNTSIQYIAEIKLKGVLWLFTPLVVSSLRKVQNLAKIGMQIKAKQLSISYSKRTK